MTRSDLIYYERRYSDEKTRAESTSCLAAKAVHQAMAERYAERLNQGELGQRTGDLHIVGG